MVANARIVAVYPYRDANGVSQYEAVRMEPKDFRQRRKAGDSYIWNLDGITPLPYRLPEVLTTIAGAGNIFKVEGEKDADNLSAALRLANVNATATTAHGGAKNWKSDQSPYFAGASVVIIPDNDKAGRDGAIIAARALRAAGVGSLKLIELPSEVNGHPVKDVSDYLAAGGTVESIMEMVATASEYYPPAEQATVSFPRTVERRQFASDDKAHLWAQHQLDRYAGEMARQTDGRRAGERSANSTALILGGIAAHGLLTESECYSALLSAAEQNGSIAKYKLEWFKGEFRRGFGDGLKQPAVLPNHVKYADDQRWAIPSADLGIEHPHISPATPCDDIGLTDVITTIDTLPSLADELATIGIKRDPHYLIIWGKPYQAAIRDIYGTRARSINRLMAAMIDHPDYGAGEPATPAELVAACEGLSFDMITRAINALNGFTRALLYIDECIYIPQNKSNSRGRKSQHRLTVIQKHQIDAALIRQYRQHLYLKLCKLAGVAALVTYQDILEGLPEYPLEDVPDLFADVERKLWAALDPAIASKHKAIMRDVENKLRQFKAKLDSSGQIRAEQDTRAAVAAAIEKFTDVSTRRNLSGAIPLAEIAEQAGVSIDTVTRHSHNLGWRRIPVIEWADKPLTSSTELPKPFSSSKRYRGAFVRLQIELPDGSIYGDASAGKQNLHKFVRTMMADGYTIRVGYRTASIWKQADDLTDDDHALIAKYNRRSEPPAKPTESAAVTTKTQSDPALVPDAPKVPALSRLMRAKMQARDNTAQQSDALGLLLKPAASNPTLLDISHIDQAIPNPTDPTAPYTLHPHEREVTTMYTELETVVADVSPFATVSTSSPVFPEDERKALQTERIRQMSALTPKRTTPAIDLIERKRLVARGEWFVATAEHHRTEQVAIEAAR